MNRIIREDIEVFLLKNGKIETRKLIAMMAKKYGVTKQCISGNIKFMTCDLRITKIIRSFPNSLIYV